MDRIDCLRAFVRTLEGGSFSAAAKELGIGQPAISKRIALLEERIRHAAVPAHDAQAQTDGRGAPHLRSRAPDHRGLRYGAVERRTGGAPPYRHAPDRRSVVVRAALHDSGHRRLCQELSGSAGRYPFQRALRQSGGRRHRTGAADRKPGGEHAGGPPARHGAAPSGCDADLSARPPDAADAGRSERAPVHRLFARCRAAHEWTFESEHGRHVAAISGPILVDDADAMQEATMQHLGIAILPDWNAAEGLRSGELEIVLPEYSIAALPLHAVYPETHWMSLRARSFLDLLVKPRRPVYPETVR